ncbi:MAG: uracil phosphoribosyltransferase [Deltaproteobacteria bacterium]|jgi:uracil phosphoribosyltransferase|nr:uracil phosphoribosyltransferase [Deltaproteobacteria bacterium]MBW2535772.1 uracil phosphoribosyltransferase [Deltaproteobacteria bacterium]
MIDIAYTHSRFVPREIEHQYGPSVHLLDDPVAWSLLSRACSPKTGQPHFGRLVRMLYESLARVVLAAELPRERIDAPTRMVTAHPEAVYRGVAIARRTKAVTVGIARAGTQPSQVLFELLNEVLDPSCVRQDHLFMSRKLDDDGQVIGTDWHDAKIGRDIQDCLVLFPDPMGATGSSLCNAIDHYKATVHGKALRYVAMHLMVTPESLRRVTTEHPDAAVYAFRLDRALSSDRALAATPGEHWDEERGLNDTQYIVPGAGGVGELLNNAWV